MCGDILLGVVVARSIQIHTFIGPEMCHSIVSVLVMLLFFQVLVLR